MRRRIRRGTYRLVLRERTSEGETLTRKGEAHYLSQAIARLRPVGSNFAERRPFKLTVIPRTIPVKRSRAGRPGPANPAGQKTVLPRGPCAPSPSTGDWTD